MKTSTRDSRIGIHTDENTRVDDIQEETLKFTMVVLSVVAGLIGTWGFACLLGGLYNYGLIGMGRGYLMAVTGM